MIRLRRCSVNLRNAHDDRTVRRDASASLADLARLRGRVKDAGRFSSDAFDAAAQQGNAAAPLLHAVDVATTEAWYLGDTTRALATIDAGLQAHPLDKIAAADRPYSALVGAYSIAGRADRAEVRKRLARMSDTEKR
jgi:hypothetical protein